MAEVKALLIEKLNERIDKTEQEKQPAERYHQETGNGFGGNRGVKHQRSRRRGDFQTRPYRGHARGQSAYTLDAQLLEELLKLRLIVTLVVKRAIMLETAL